MAPVTRGTILLNEASRGASAARAGTIEAACARAGLTARVVRVGRDDLFEAADREAAESDVLIAAGGDGTVSTVANVAVRAGATFGVIQLGTLNHFARDVGIPRTVEGAIGVIAAGRTRMLDVGELNSALFLNNASLGMYPRLVWERELEEAHGRGRWTAFAIALTRSWRRYRTIDVRLTMDGGAAFSRQTPFVFVGNGDYQVEGLELGKRPSVDSGRLSVFVAPDLTRVAALALPFRALARRLRTDRRFEAFSATALALDSNTREMSVALDGEIMLAPLPFRFTVRRRALRTLVPEER